MQVKLSPKSELQLIEIWEYTENTWGNNQAHDYVEGLFLFLQQLDSKRFNWVKVQNALGLEIYSIRYLKHVLFFTSSQPDRIEILTILHEKMNLPKRLAEDLKRD